MRFYAQQSPRGFANEVITYFFATKASRDKWAEMHKDDGDCNSASQGAEAIKAKQARLNVTCKGSYNSGYIDGDQELGGGEE